MKIESFKFEKINGEWHLSMSIMPDDGVRYVWVALVPPEMIFDMAPPYQIGSEAE